MLERPAPGAVEADDPPIREVLHERLPHVGAAADAGNQEQRLALAALRDADPVPPPMDEITLHADPPPSPRTPRCASTASRRARPATMPTCPPGRRRISACGTSERIASTPAGGAIVSFSADTDSTGIATDAQSTDRSRDRRPCPSSSRSCRGRACDRARPSRRPGAGTTSSTQLAIVRTSRSRSGASSSRSQRSLTRPTTLLEPGASISNQLLTSAAGTSRGLS